MSKEAIKTEPWFYRRNWSKPVCRQCDYHEIVIIQRRPSSYVMHTEVGVLLGSANRSLHMWRSRSEDPICMAAFTPVKPAPEPHTILKQPSNHWVKYSAKPPVQIDPAVGMTQNPNSYVASLTVGNSPGAYKLTTPGDEENDFITYLEKNQVLLRRVVELAGGHQFFFKRIEADGNEFPVAYRPLGTQCLKIKELI